MGAILLTGGYGFLGSHLLKKISNKNDNIIVLEKSFASNWRVRDLNIRYKLYYEDKCNLENIFKNNKIDIIVNAAVNYGRSSSKTDVILDNILFPLKLIKIGKMYNLKLFINTDSYFSKNNCFIDYLNEYILSKRQLLDWLYMDNNVKLFNLRLEHIYGPNDSENKFIFHIFNSLIRNNPKLELTRGLQKRDFVYIDDVIYLYLEIIKKVDKFENRLYDIEVGTGNSVSIKEFVLLIKNILGNKTTKLEFGKIPMRKNEILDSRADLSKIPSDIKWKARIDIKSGIERMVDYYRKKEN